MTGVLIRGHLDAGTPCEDMERWLFVSQGARLRKKSALTTLSSQTSSLQDLFKPWSLGYFVIAALGNQSKIRVCLRLGELRSIIKLSIIALFGAFSSNIVTFPPPCLLLYPFLTSVLLFITMFLLSDLSIQLLTQRCKKLIYSLWVRINFLKKEKKNERENKVKLKTT
jgi:hypothetical protein